MDIVEALLNTIDSATINKMAKDAINSWSSEDEENRDLLISSELVFKSHKFCFKSAEFNYPFFETTYNVVREGAELGMYKIFTSIEGEAVDDYYKIYESLNTESVCP